ncbi:hypothetical protein MalM25_16090 [Planctomycetes bacterium MalM25]|nr:hypothetical protein MalM25_16090 [Planctomycetes bacterium MalM25]
MNGRSAAPALSHLGALLLVLQGGGLLAQDIRFNPNGPTVRIEPFFEFDGGFPEFCGNACGFTQGTPTLTTPLLPTDIESLPNGHYLVNTLGGTIKLVDTQGKLRGDFLTPAETGVSYVDSIRFGSTSLELHPDFNSPGAFGYGKAYHISAQLPSEGTRRNIPETGIPADFSAVEKRAYGDTTADNGATGLSPEGSSFAFQTAIREYDLSAWVASGYAADSLTGGAAPPARDILRIDQTGNNHTTYDLAFNAAGDLFITTGDGGFQEGPTHPDFAGRVRRQSSQDLNTVFGKVFRINPDVNAPHAGRVGGNGQYSIPADNPYFDTTPDPEFVLAPGADPENDGDPDSTLANSTIYQNNDGTLDEIWAVGLRSPIRVENDRRDASGNTLVLSDVGGGSREEATRFTRGSNDNAPNLGWGRYEGNLSITSSIALAPNSDLVFPDFEYNHSGNSLTETGGVFTGFDATVGGVAIEGGEVYLGQLLGEDFDETYIAAELGFHGGGSSKLSRIILGDFDNPGDFYGLNIDPTGQRFEAPRLEAEDFAPGFDFDQAGIDFFGDGTRLLPERVYGIYADSKTGELFLLGGSTAGAATLSRIVPVGFEAPLAGDYNSDGAVDAADYTVWRDTVGATGLPLYSGADGNGDGTVDGTVDGVDYQVWKDNYGASLPSNSAGVPEPTALALLALTLGSRAIRRRR